MGERKEKLISVVGVSQTGWKRAGMGGGTEGHRVAGGGRVQALVCVDPEAEGVDRAKIERSHGVDQAALPKHPVSEPEKAPGDAHLECHDNSTLHI